MANLALKWLRLGQNSQFCRFFYLSPKIRLRLTWNGQFHLIHNFSHLLPPKHLIFGEISKIFISGGGCTSAKFLSFPTFSNCFTPMWLKMTHNGKFGLKSGLNGSKGQFCMFFYLFPQNEAGIDSEWSISLIHNFSHLCHQRVSFFGEISKFSFGGGYIGNFFSFPTFSNHFTPMQLKMTHNGKFGQKIGLDWVKMANFACFSIFSPK